MQLNKGGDAGPPSPQVMYAAHFRVRDCNTSDGVALVDRKFPIHQVVKGLAHNSPGAIQDINRNAYCKQSVKSSPAFNGKH